MVCQQAQNGGTKGRQLTFWRAEDVVYQQVKNGGIKGRHSPAGEQRVQCVSRCKTEGSRADTHKLDSRGRAVSAGTAWRDRRRALMNWRADVLTLLQCFLFEGVWVVSDEVQWQRWGHFTCLPCKYPTTQAF